MSMPTDGSSTADPAAPSTPPTQGRGSSFSQNNTQQQGLWGGNTSGWGGNNMFGTGSAFGGGATTGTDADRTQNFASGRPGPLDVQPSGDIGSFLSLSPGQALGNKIRKAEQQQQQNNGTNDPTTSSHLSNEMTLAADGSGAQDAASSAPSSSTANGSRP